MYQYIYKSVFLISICLVLNVRAQRQAAKITLDESEVDMFEIKSNTNFKKCKEQCYFSLDCLFVNYHTRSKVCYKSYKTGDDKTYFAETEKGSGFFSWERDRTKRKSKKPKKEVKQDPTTTTTKQLPTTTESTLSQSTAKAFSTTTDSNAQVTAPGESTVQTSNVAPEKTTVQPSNAAPDKTTVQTGIVNEHGDAFKATTILSTRRDSLETTTNTSTQDSDTGYGGLSRKPTSSETTTFSGHLESTTNAGLAKTNTVDENEDHNGDLSKTTETRTTTGQNKDESGGEFRDPETFCNLYPHHEYCVIFCPPPKKFRSIPHNGNLFTIGSRQAYRCFDQESQTWYSQIMICTEQGRWNNTGNVCSYQDPIYVEGKKIMYKFVDAVATQKGAFDNCKRENARLVTVTSKQLPGILRDHFEKFEGDYWTDSNRRSFGKWYTSDGVRVPAGVKVWAVFASSTWTNLVSSNPDECASLQPNFRIKQRNCGERIPYMCERVM